jgi:hypothetical protein
MPLQKKFNFTNDINDKNAKVYVSAATEKNNEIFTATIQNAVEKDNRVTITVLFSSPKVNYVKSYFFTPSGADDLNLQGYKYLKTLPAFEGAIDC